MIGGTYIVRTGEPIIEAAKEAIRSAKTIGWPVRLACNGIEIEVTEDSIAGEVAAEYWRQWNAKGKK